MKMITYYEIDGSRYSVELHESGTIDIFNADTGEHLNDESPWYDNLALKWNASKSGVAVVDHREIPSEPEVRWFIDTIVNKDDQGGE